ncbi:MAG TPA: MoxR family ATPase, partial [Actinomycetota bacterium]|nr:MoxR family ATPase [Actinomycetota bacterium]
FLLEVLSDFQVTIPELGTIKCKKPPVVILTSNRTRELHDALKRRCLFHWIDYPKLDREVEIVRARAPEIPEELARQVSKAVQNLRTRDLQKRSGGGGELGWFEGLAKGLTGARPQETLRVPDLVGLRLAEARRVAEAAGAGVAIADDGQAGDGARVVRQEPVPGSEFSDGRVVTVWTQEGPGSAGVREPGPAAPAQRGFSVGMDPEGR